MHAVPEEGIALPRRTVYTQVYMKLHINMYLESKMFLLNTADLSDTDTVMNVLCIQYMHISDNLIIPVHDMYSFYMYMYSNTNQFGHAESTHPLLHCLH